MADPKDDEANARERTMGEIVTGAVIELPDGTIIEGGVVTKVGSRAIVENGKFLGMRDPD